MSISYHNLWFFVFKFVCNLFNFMYVSWLHEQICCIISFQIIVKNLVCFRNRIAYFGTDLRKKVFNSSAMRFELDISIPFTMNVFGSFKDCSLLVVEQPTFPKCCAYGYLACLYSTLLWLFF